jgi:DNA-binding MarR family transcriptional regulator
VPAGPKVASAGATMLAHGDPSRRNRPIRSIVSAEWFGVSQASVTSEGTAAIPADHRTTAIDETIAGYESLMQRLAGAHEPDFLEIDVTMPQAKLLYLLGASGDLHMSEIVHRLGVSLSTVSGLVDRIVDHGLATRRDDPADRRQVVVGLTPAGTAFIDRFRELNARQMRQLLEDLDDTDLALVREALIALDRAASRSTARKDPA